MSNVVQRKYKRDLDFWVEIKNIQHVLLVFVASALRYTNIIITVGL